MGSPMAVDESTFQGAVLEAPTPVLVDFWAPWCPPCKAVAPIIDELATEYDGKVGFAKVNVDEAPTISSKYGVSSIPTLLLFKGGLPMSGVVGFRPKAELKRLLDEALG